MAFVTEEQARKKNCVKSGSFLCVGSSCMGWRWEPKQTRYVKEGTAVPDGWVEITDEWGERNIDEGDGKSKYTEYEKVETERNGYCGIAGYVSTDN